MLLQAEDAVRLRDEELFASSFTHCRHVETELQRRKESVLDRGLSKQTKYNWSKLENSIKTKKGIYPGEPVHNVWFNPKKSTKEKHQHGSQEENSA